MSDAIPPTPPLLIVDTMFHQLLAPARGGVPAAVAHLEKLMTDTGFAPVTFGLNFVVLLPAVSQHEARMLAEAQKTNILLATLTTLVGRLVLGDTPSEHSAETRRVLQEVVDLAKPAPQEDPQTPAPETT